MSAAAEPKHRALGLTDAEADRIVELMGREPTDPELVMFSLMWSEHCSYKHSRKLLRRFPSGGKAVLQGPGENAGVVDVGDGMAVALKIESHNHPSAVEPFEGAATGVGGIVRDILAMGARPIALLDSLRFGQPSGSRSRHLFVRAVAGIGHYGNCIGVPTVGGEVAFDDRFEDSCLVNAMCVGLVDPRRMLRAAAAGAGNAVVLIGNRTGADGIGGASVLASAELDEDEDKRPSVQVSDPFTERKLMDCCLELAERGLMVALQDLGAAGLTSAASEMAAKGGVGLDLDLDRVPLRQPLAPAEILVSESQERMLAIVEPPTVAEVAAVCRRWELDANVIGTVTEGGNLVARAGGDIIVDIPAALLADDAPLYDVPLHAPPEPEPLDIRTVPEPPDLSAAWLELLARPNIADKAWVYEQYDHLVGANTALRPGGDAAVIRLPDSDKGLAITTDCAERHTELDAWGGGASSVLEAARNLAAVGARPLAASDCLNFPNPEKGSTGWRLREAIEGMSQALEALEVPIVSGNVSLYNESPARAIYPTPVVGMVGLIRTVSSRCSHAFADEGDLVLLAGDGAPRLDGSEWLGEPRGRPERPDLPAEAGLIDAVIGAVEKGLLKSAHDVSAGGLATALAESAIAGGTGASVTAPEGRRPDEALFGEGPGRFVLTCAPDDLPAVVAVFGDVPLSSIGAVGGTVVEVAVGDATASVTVDDARAAHSGGLREAMA